LCVSILLNVIVYVYLTEEDCLSLTSSLRKLF